MMQFIYVVGKDHRDQMLELGYELISGDEANDVWAFANDDVTRYSVGLDIPHILSNTMVF